MNVTVRKKTNKIKFVHKMKQYKKRKTSGLQNVSSELLLSK